MKNKNTRLLNGVPLIAYTIAAAQKSKIFGAIVVSSEDDEILRIAQRYCAGVLRRPSYFSTNESPDIEWVKHALDSSLLTRGIEFDYFAILRPTSPFRSAKTIQRAWAEFERSDMDCLRAVSPAPVNPWKCWIESNCELTPLMWQSDNPPWHSRPTQSLPRIVVQNASLEMAKCSLVRDRLYPSICGGRVWAFHSELPDSFDLNTEEDFSYAEYMVKEGKWTLPTV